MSEFSDKVHEIVNADFAADKDYVEHLDYIRNNRVLWEDADVATDFGRMLVYYFEANRRLAVDGHKPEGSDKLEEIYRQYGHRLASQHKVDMLRSLSLTVLQEVKNGIEVENIGYAKARDYVKDIYYISTDEIYKDISGGVKTVFSFRPFSKYALKDICLNEITLCNPSLFNDPFDTVFPHWIDYTLGKLKGGRSCAYKHQLIMKDTFKSMKARSLVLAPEGNVRKLPKLMWAHYADEHKGFCIKYKIDKDFFYSHSASKSALACF